MKTFKLNWIIVILMLILGGLTWDIRKLNAHAEQQQAEGISITQPNEASLPSAPVTPFLWESLEAEPFHHFYALFTGPECLLEPAAQRIIYPKSSNKTLSQTAVEPSLKEAWVIRAWGKSQATYGCLLSHQSSKLGFYVESGTHLPELNLICIEIIPAQDPYKAPCIVLLDTHSNHTFQIQL